MVPPRTQADKGKAPVDKSAPLVPSRGRPRSLGIMIEEPTRQEYPSRRGPQTEAVWWAQTLTEAISPKDCTSRNITERRRMARLFGDLDYQYVRPSPFMGEYDIKAVARWIEGMERAFDYWECPDHRKVWYATSMLRGDAETWWWVERQLAADENRTMSWEEFRARFIRHYAVVTGDTQRMIDHIAQIQDEGQGVFCSYCLRIIPPHEECPHFYELELWQWGDIHAVGSVGWGPASDQQPPPLPSRIPTEEEMLASATEEALPEEVADNFTT